MIVENASIPKVVYHNLEGLRGFAALLVFWCHAIGYYHYLDPNYTPYGLSAYQAPAHFSVLIFFVLSGYVIGISNREPLERVTIWLYVKKRLVRIYPIYAISILFTLLIAPKSYPIQTIAGNLSFLQVAATPVILEINPIWSLNSEILFYLLFIPISYFRIKPLIIIFLSIALGLANRLFFPSHPLLSTYSFGFTFWVCGLLLAHTTNNVPQHGIPYRLLLGLLLLFVSLGSYDFLGHFLVKITNFLTIDLHYPSGSDLFEANINVYDFAYLPYAVLGICLFTDRDLPGRKVTLYALWLLPLVSVIKFFLDWYKLTSHAVYVIPTLAYAASLLAFLPNGYFDKIGKYIIDNLARLGSISYGLYIIHLPIMSALKRVDQFSGTGLTYALRFVVLLLLSLFISWILEKKIQPFFRRLLY